MCDNTVASVGLLLTKKKLDTKENIMGFPDGSVVKNLPAKAGDTGLISSLERSRMQRATKAVSRSY